ncbi:MAG: hypothetical protein OEZ25_08085 [Candidatus Bathyarchaeota archaeon]|nr:hypothetical protein [Candidatus Bathyarchaeota archaeon]
MIRLCDYVLSADQNIRFAMHVDHFGNIQCMKSIGLYQLPADTAQKLADTVAVLTAGILKTFSQHHGCFQHLTLKHQNYTTIAQATKTGVLIYTTIEPIESKTVQHIKETIEIYLEQEL